MFFFFFGFLSSVVVFVHDTTYVYMVTRLWLFFAIRNADRASQLFVTE